MKLVVSLLICIILIPFSVSGTELGSGDGTVNGNGTEQSSRGLDFSNVEPRENIHLCSEQDLQERQEQQDLCVRNFAELGITQTIRPHEVIEAQSCDRIERFSEHMSGCAQFFLELPGETLSGVVSLFNSGRFSEQIQQECGESRRALTRLENAGFDYLTGEGNNPEALRRARNNYSTCANGVRDLGAETEANLEARIDGYRNQCRPSAHPVMLDRFGDRVIRGCVLERAGRDGCDECIAELNQVSVTTRVFQTVLDEFKKYRGFSCYNKKTQGRMVCAAIATAAGIPLGGTAASLAAKLPAAFRGAQTAARGPVSRLGAAATEVEETATDIAAVQAGRVSEEVLTANSALSDVDRVLTAQRLLGGGTFTPEQSAALIRAHEVGSSRPGAGFGNYTQSELRQKNRILTNAGFDTEQRRLLMDQGVVGNLAASTSPVGMSWGELASMTPEQRHQMSGPSFSQAAERHVNSITVWPSSPTHTQGRALELNETEAALSATERQAIVGYTDTDYLEINDSIASGASLSSCDNCTTLNTAISRLPAYTGTVYRATHIPNTEDYIRWLTPGEVVRDSRFLSTSRTPSGELDLGGGNNPIRMIIESRSGRSIEVLSTRPGEREVLFPPGVRFRVDRVWRDTSGVPQVYLREIP